jgi:predicted heme/steroid binding protein
MAKLIDFFCFFLLNYSGKVQGQKYLSVNGTNLMLNGEKVFLSGMNQAWYKYGSDFGNKSYINSKPHLMHTLDALKTNGGNSISMI